MVLKQRPGMEVIFIDSKILTKNKQKNPKTKQTSTSKSLKYLYIKNILSNKQYMCNLTNPIKVKLPINVNISHHYKVIKM